MKLVEVKDKQTANDFINLPIELYRNESHWIRPLDKDVNNVFDKQKNKYYRNGELIRWVFKKMKMSRLSVGSLHLSIKKQ
jgi:hypothetical protein